MPQTPQQAEELLCRWAEKKYSLHNVVGVIFEPTHEGSELDDTPNIYHYVEVAVYVEGKKRPYKFEVLDYYTTDLIKEILQFSKESN